MKKVYISQSFKCPKPSIVEEAVKIFDICSTDEYDKIANPLMNIIRKVYEIPDKFITIIGRKNEEYDYILVFDETSDSKVYGLNKDEDGNIYIEVEDNETN